MNDSIENISKELRKNERSEPQKEGKREKYLIFSLSDETYGVPLSTVKEVIGITEITEVPQVPDYFKGLINLRGKIISVVDLRTKLKLPKADYKDKKTCIIIVEIGDFTLGTIVDDVMEVSGFMQDQIEYGLDIQSKISRDFILGVAKTDSKKLTLLLDAAKVLNIEELELLKKKAA